MKLLVDSNIIINAINKSVSYDFILKNNELYTCGVIESEILIGSKDENNFKNLVNLLNNFVHLEFWEDYWIDFSHFIFTLKRNGISVPFQDSIIAYLALKNDCTILTEDKHFKLIQKIFTDIKLYSC